MVQNFSHIMIQRTIVYYFNKASLYQWMALVEGNSVELTITAIHGITLIKTKPKLGFG